ncbi:MAG: S1C family serine protease [Phycisphaerae bacterium]
MDSAQQRWEETGRRCRGELLLVHNDGSLLPAPAFQCADDGPDDAACLRLRAAADAARRFTVAVRARLPQPAGPADAFGQGTGTVIDSQGHILTNAHVVGTADLAEVFIAGEGWASARVVGRDAWSDLAVLAADRLPPDHARLTDAGAVRPGEMVAAVGYPAGSRLAEPARIFLGRLRAHGRCLQGALDPQQKHFYAALLEAAVPLAPGCSGGPLIDSDGRVIGICTAAATDDAAKERLGYAIPISERTRPVIDRLVLGCTIEHGYLGMLVRAACATPPDGTIAGPTGVVVERVLADEPAERAGLRPGDIITHLGNDAVQDGAQLVQLVRTKPVGARVEMRIIRGNRPVSVAVTIATRARRPAISAIQ